MNYLVGYPLQSLPYDSLKSPTRSDSSKDEMEPLLLDIEGENPSENIVENLTDIDIEEEFQDQNLLQGEKTDEELVTYKLESGSYQEDFHTPETQETKLTSEEIKENPPPPLLEDPQTTHLSNLEFQYKQIEIEYRGILTQVNQIKGIEFLEQEIKLFYDFIQERQRCFHNPPTIPEPPQDSPKEGDLQAGNDEPLSSMKNHGDTNLNIELLSPSRSFDTAQNSEENQDEKTEISSPNRRQKAGDLLEDSPQEGSSQKQKEMPQEKEENKQAENYSIPQDLSFNPGHYLENSPKSETRVYQDGRQNENFERNEVNSYPSKSNSPKFFGLKNLGKTCYMNALFRCLFEVKPFYEEILRIKEYPKFPLIKHFAQLFCKMKNCHEYKDSRLLDFHHQNLVSLIYKTRKEFKPYEEGDSSLLFRAILEELNDGRDFVQLPHLQMFAGDPLTKGFECTRCRFFKKTQESLHILEVKDINFIPKKQENFFQSSQEKRFCRCSHSQNDFNCFYGAPSLPQVLAIRINDTVGSQAQVKILPRISLFQYDNYGRPQKKVQYEFVSSVLNSFKGKDGSHSVAICYQQGKYYVYDDNKPPQEIAFRNIEGHPQLLFYIKSEK